MERRPPDATDAAFTILDGALACTILLPWIGAGDFRVPGIGLPAIGEMIVAVGDGNRLSLVPLYLVYPAFAAAVVAATLRFVGVKAAVRAELPAALILIALQVFVVASARTSNGFEAGFWIAFGVAAAVVGAGVVAVVRDLRRKSG